MKSISLLILLLFASLQTAQAQVGMSNDLNFDARVELPAYPTGTGPVILVDGAHHNFFVKNDFMIPFINVVKLDGYQVVVDSMIFTPDYLAQFDIVLIIHALPFDFQTKLEVTDEATFTNDELNSLHDWVQNGGSLIVFSEHAPFDQAINPLLDRFGIISSVGYTIDSLHYNREIGLPGWIEYTNENGLLNTEHPIIRGRNAYESVNRILSFGGSSITGAGYTNLFRLSDTAENTKHHTGVGPIGMGNSQCLAGSFGEGKIIAFGDSNGFSAMLFHDEDGSARKAGMNREQYDWKQFVLNTLRWLSGELE